VLYTDGLYEQENAAGEQFGHQRLLDAVAGRLREPCYTLLDELVKETQQFSGQIDFADDVCLVGMDVVDGTATGRRAA
jgi:serine phosphatase RsbU (regulator of sigma subunit)